MKLIFVYNADSGLANTIKDIGQKLFAPQTYDCLLCSLTHGTFRENPEWKSFRQKANTQMLFLHRDEFEQQYDTKLEYPVILKEGDSLEVAVSKEQMAAFATLDDLIGAVKSIEGQAGS